MYIHEIHLFSTYSACWCLQEVMQATFVSSSNSSLLTIPPQLRQELIFLSLQVGLFCSSQRKITSDGLLYCCYLPVTLLSRQGVACMDCTQLPFHAQIIFLGIDIPHLIDPLISRQTSGCYFTALVNTFVSNRDVQVFMKMGICSSLKLSCWVVR